jgi:hypothetical protein
MYTVAGVRHESGLRTVHAYHIAAKNNVHVVYADLLTVSSVCIMIMHYRCRNKNSIRDGG